MKLITNEKMVLKYGSKPTVVNTKIFNSNLVAILKTKEAITIRKSKGVVERSETFGRCSVISRKRY